MGREGWAWDQEEDLWKIRTGPLQTYWDQRAGRGVRVDQVGWGVGVGGRGSLGTEVEFSGWNYKRGCVASTEEWGRADLDGA